MHEFSVATNLVEIAAAEARRRGALRIVRIDCRVGELCCIDGQLLAEAFELAREGTACAAAELRVARSALKARCEACGREFPVRDWDWNCPDCGVGGRIVGGGDELELTALELEFDDGCPSGASAARAE